MLPKTGTQGIVIHKHGELFGKNIAIVARNQEAVVAIDNNHSGPVSTSKLTRGTEKAFASRSTMGSPREAT